MTKFPLTDSLRAEYENLFNTCELNLTRLAEINTLVDRISASKPIYQAAGASQSIPWFFVGAVHCMEGGLNFSTHLHNGDPLTARTVKFPPGRPLQPDPPYTWDTSAADALAMRGLGQVTDWTLAGLLFQLESYNGFGYRTQDPPIATPYLWSGSNQYTKGKFVSDGKYDPNFVSGQIGAAVLVRRMVERHIVERDMQGNPILDRPLSTPNPNETVSNLEPLVTYSTTVFSQQALRLQMALNRIPGIAVLVDGFAGARTSDAIRQLTGHFLKGDPRLDSTPPTPAI